MYEVITTSVRSQQSTQPLAVGRLKKKKKVRNQLAGTIAWLQTMCQERNMLLRLENEGLSKL